VVFLAAGQSTSWGGMDPIVVTENNSLAVHGLLWLTTAGSARVHAWREIQMMVMYHVHGHDNIPFIAMVLFAYRPLLFDSGQFGCVQRNFWYPVTSRFSAVVQALESAHK
jgi:hypothetical protein